VNVVGESQTSKPTARTPTTAKNSTALTPTTRKALTVKLYTQQELLVKARLQNPLHEHQQWRKTQLPESLNQSIDPGSLNACSSKTNMGFPDEKVG